MDFLEVSLINSITFHLILVVTAIYLISGSMFCGIFSPLNELVYNLANELLFKSKVSLNLWGWRDFL